MPYSRLVGAKHKRGLTVRRVRLIVVMFLVNILAFLLLLYGQMIISNGVRAFIRGEGLWGKAQKQAHVELTNYAWSHDERYYRAYLEQLRIPEGDRLLRTSLQHSPPNMEGAYIGFIEGNNDPQDFDDLTRVFLWFKFEPHVAQAITIWTEADQSLARVKQLAADLHNEISRSPPREEYLQELTTQLETLNDELTILEFRFSKTLSEAARFAAHAGWWGSLLLMLILLGGTLLIAWRITQSIEQTERALVESEERLHKLSHHDTLTGLPNRLMFQQLVNSATLRARRHNSGMALLFLDLDNFKGVNDTYGHDAGDEVLREISRRLVSAIRASDTVARLGGDEFVVLLEEVEDRSVAVQVAEVILDCSKNPIELSSGGQWKVGISIGIACYPEDGEDIDTLTRSADSAMYQVKKQGKNGYSFHNRRCNRTATIVST